MSGRLQGAWGLGFLLASLVHGLFYVHIGRRGMLWLGILQALLCLYIRFFVKASEIWQENNKKRIEQQRLETADRTSWLATARIAVVLGWLIGAVAVAVALFYALKAVAPLLGSIVEPKLLALLLDDKLLGVVAAGFTPLVLPNLAALLGVSIPTQLAILASRRRCAARRARFAITSARSLGASSRPLSPISPWTRAWGFPSRCSTARSSVPDRRRCAGAEPLGPEAK
jgi:hypothetical protein